MGGQNQAVAEPPKPSAKPVSIPKSSKKSKGKINPTRFHESNGEIHFHDDVSGLKVAVPVAEAFGVWQNFENSPMADPIMFVDSKRQTQAVLSWVKSSKEVDVQIVVSKIKTGKNLKSLQTMFNG